MRLLTTLLLTSATLLAGCNAFLGEPAKITSITIEPGDITVAENGMVPLKAIVRDSRGTEMPDVEVYWISQDYSVANVGPMPTTAVYGAGPGTTAIEAHAADKVATATVTVTRGVVKSVSVSPNRFVVVPGQPTQLYVQANDEQGHMLRYRPATFSSANNIATVTPQGSVTGIVPGLATIVVTVDGVSTNVPLRVSPTTVSFEYYKRGGTTTPGTATLTFDPFNINSGTLAIDGKSLKMYTSVTYDLGVTCLYSPLVGSPSPDAIGRCMFDPSPRTIRLCTPVNGILDPGQLQYVLLPANDSSRVPATASAVVSAVLNNTAFQGINVHTSCTSAAAPPGSTMPQRWVRNAPGTELFLWPDLITMYSGTSVAALLDGAVIYSAPGAGLDFTKYVAIRVSATVFEVWH